MNRLTPQFDGKTKVLLDMLDVHLKKNNGFIKTDFYDFKYIYDGPFLVSETKSFPLESIIIVNIEQPTENERDPMDKSPVTHVFDYLEKVRKGEAFTVDGCPIPPSQNVPVFCYIVCDLTESMRRSCRFLDLTKTNDGMRYFGYNKNYKTYIEVLSFEKLKSWRS
ncbi:hypothetical protein [Bartonella harrusi]|uniref:Phage related protein n=1 Tax=Bartonella harrusi TaxID=2961895 RepID=A0ABY5ETI9_9HYPH|nr:hypothetical protein [Bartonella harrusi]UTO28726.1 hypothetical protein NMK50_01515 [Bartonella harrusi]